MHFNVIVIKVAHSFFFGGDIHCCFIRKFNDLTRCYVLQINAGLKFLIDVPFLEIFIFFTDDRVVNNDFIPHWHNSFDFSMFCAVVAFCLHTMNVFKVNIIFKFTLLFLVQSCILKERQKSFSLVLSVDCLQTLIYFLTLFKNMLKDMIYWRNFAFVWNAWLFCLFSLPFFFLFVCWSFSRSWFWRFVFKNVSNRLRK